MTRLTLAFLLLSSCGGGAALGPVASPPVVPPVVSDYALTPNHRFGLRNDWIIGIEYVRLVSYAEDLEAVFYLPHFTHGVVWEAPEGFEIPDGAYWIQYERVPGGVTNIDIEYVRGVKDARVLR